MILASKLAWLVGSWCSKFVLIVFGRLPGDLRIEREGFGFYFPLTTSLILSLLVSLLLWLFRR